MTRNALIPVCVAAMIVTGAASTYSAFKFSKDYKVDTYLANSSATLSVSAMNSITLAMRASSDATFITELESAVNQVDAAFKSLKLVESETGQPMPDSIATTLSAFDESWSKVTSAITQITKSKDGNASFARQASAANRDLEALLEQSAAATQVVSSAGAIKPETKAALNAAQKDLEAGISTGLRGQSANSENARLALESTSLYLERLAEIGRIVPNDKAIIDPLLKAYRTGQAAKVSTKRAVDAAGESTNNSQYAQDVWAERARIESAVSNLQLAIRNLPASHPVTPMLVSLATLLAFIVSIAGVLLILRQAKNRTRRAIETESSIQSFQKIRSNELQQLFDEMELVKRGDLTVVFREDLESTRELAVILNKVFSQVREVLRGVQQTILSLSAASEQTLSMAQSVNRNRDDQDRAIDHIAKQNEELNAFIGDIENLTARTKDSSQEVKTIVRDGSDAVKVVHEGIQILTGSLMNVMHQTKSMTENMQNLERLLTMVSQVSLQSETVAMNAFLVADGINDEVQSRRIRRSGEQMHSLARGAKTAVEQIQASLRGINDAAKETQFVLDQSQNEMKELSGRSTYALEALNTIREQSSQLTESIISVTEKTTKLKSQSERVAQTMTSIHHYSSENSAASEQTASAISNLNIQAQQLGESLAQYTV